MIPAIVIPAFQKTASLERLLNSLLRGDYSGFNPPLVFSIEPNASEAVKRIIESFSWPFGEKIVLRQPERLGLDRHILACGDLSTAYGSIILLEDDSFVSPYFYLFACEALAFYADDSSIAQLSLYSYPFNEITSYPFIPLSSEQDVYLIRKPCSRGQAWTAMQWQAFRNFMKDHEKEYKRPQLPTRLLAWDESNWERMFTWYLAQSKKYVLYPYRSYSSMFGDLGYHVKERSSRYAFQSALAVLPASSKLKPAKDIEVRYDEYFELDPAVLKAYNKLLAPYNFSVDLNGSKEEYAIENDLVLTSRKARKSILSFGRELRPVEANVISSLPGNDLVLAEKRDLSFNEGFWQRRTRRKADMVYHYPDIPRFRF